MPNKNIWDFPTASADNLTYLSASRFIADVANNGEPLDTVHYTGAQLQTFFQDGVLLQMSPAPVSGNIILANGSGSLLDSGWTISQLTGSGGGGGNAAYIESPDAGTRAEAVDGFLFRTTISGNVITETTNTTEVTNMVLSGGYTYSRTAGTAGLFPNGYGVKEIILSPGMPVPNFPTPGSPTDNFSQITLGTADGLTMGFSVLAASGDFTKITHLAVGRLPSDNSLSLFASDFSTGEATNIIAGPTETSISTPELKFPGQWSIGTSDPVDLGVRLVLMDNSSGVVSTCSASFYAPVFTKQLHENTSRAFTDSDAGKILFMNTSSGTETLTVTGSILSSNWNTMVIREGANDLVVQGDNTTVLVGPAVVSGSVTVGVDYGAVTLIRRSAAQVWCAGVTS